MLLRVIGFYILAFAFTFILGGIQQATGLSQETLILPECGPGLAALLTLLIFRKDGHRLSIFERKIPASRYIFAVLIPAGGALVVYLINSFALNTINFGNLTGIPWFLLLWMPMGAFGEELGWRGYLHKRLDIRLTGPASSFIVGVLWALWHIGSYTNGALYMAFFVLSIISYTFVLYALVADTGFNVLVASIFHLIINITNLFSFSIINDLEFVMTNSLVWVTIAFIVALTRRSLFRAKKTTH